MNELIYLDNYSTTPVDSRVLTEMLPYFSEKIANPSSSHPMGQLMKDKVNESRVQVADLLNVLSSEIFFTSGATESINLALKGYALSNLSKGNHIITTQTEHKAVINTCRFLETIGFEVTYLPVSRDGLVDLQNLYDEIRTNTILISIMYANNEIGVIQPISEIGKISKEKGILFFCDATQAVGKVPVFPEELGVDILAFSGHKFYGPKGIGCIYIKNFQRNRKYFFPQMHGGGQEEGIRSGTLNVPGIIGLGKAAELALSEMDEEKTKIEILRNKLELGLLEIPNSFVNGSTKSRMYNATNICFRNIESSIIIKQLKNVAISNGSACSSALIEPSYVLKSIGLNDDDASSSIRFSLGKYNTLEEIETVIQLMKNTILNCNHYA